MSATVVPLRGSRQQLLSKKQLAAELEKSPRWIELRQREGLPIHSTDRFGHRKYDLRAVRAWLDERPAGPVSVVDRLACLEAEVRVLRLMVEGKR